MSVGGNASMYTSLPFSLCDDGELTKTSRRCTLPRMDKTEDGITIYHYDVTPPVPTSFPHDERWCSPLAHGFRAPNLPPSCWEREGIYHSDLCDMPGTRVQIFSIINSVNIKTIYVLELTDHPFKKWKCIIVSFHVSEDYYFVPNFANECDID